MAGIIPKEQLAAYQRWQANDFDTTTATNSVPVTSATAGETPPETTGTAGSSSAANTLSIPLPTADEIEQIHEQARNEGFAAGFAEGRQAAEAEVAAWREGEMARLKTLTATLRQAIDGIDQAVADQVLDLALEVASLVTGSRLKVQRDLLLPVIREGLQVLPLHHGGIALHLNPEDLAALRDLLDELVSHNNLNLVPDSSVTPGGCIFKAGHSEVDARLETRWQRVLESIGVDPERWTIR